MVYRATEGHTDAALIPFGWYWDFVAEGAREHGLPADYVARFIDSVRRIDDPDPARERVERGKRDPG